MTPEPERIAALIAEIAAEEIVPRFHRLTKGEIREKGPGDLVTVVDLAVESRLERALPDLYPGSVVLAEEAAAADPSLIARLAGDAPVWVIDPIDGTANFAAGNPHFAVMVALVRKDRPVMSWIFDPLEKIMVQAEEGGGAWGKDGRLRVAESASPEALRGVLLAGHFGDRSLGRRLQERRHRVAAVKSLRSAAHEYLRLARGEIHFALFTRLMPWDHAAGVLIHREAGGHSAYLDGGAYRAASIDRPGLMLAPDRAAWSSLHGIFFD